MRIPCVGSDPIGITLNQIQLQRKSTTMQSNEVRIPKPEFATGDNNTSPYFKSSFARSLSTYTFGSSPQSKSLDFTINYGFNHDEDEGTLINSTALFEQCHMSMPPVFTSRRCTTRTAMGGDATRMPAVEQSTESLASSSSVATTVPNVNVWTNAQVRYLLTCLFFAIKCKHATSCTHVASSASPTRRCTVGRGVG